MTSDWIPGRRGLLALGAASLLDEHILARGAGAVPAPPVSRDARLATLEALGPAVDVFTKMRADLHEGTVAYLTRALVYAYLNDPSAPLPVPLMGAEGLTFTKHVRIDGGWRQLMHEVNYFTDFETHEVWEERKNPVTSRVVKAKHYRGDQTLDFVGSQIRFPLLPPGFESRSHFSAPIVQGGSAFVHEHIMTREPPPPPSGPLRRIDTVLGVYASPLEDLLDGARTSARCTCHFSIVGRFPSWLQMDDVPGRVVWAGHSTKLEDLNQVTPWLIERIARDHPDYLRNAQG